MSPAMPALSHRPVGADDLAEVVRFPRDADELFFAYPRATWPFSVEQLADAIAQRQGSTVALLDGRIAGFANFYQWEPGAYCALGNMLVADWARGQGVAQYLIGVMEQQARAGYDAKLMKISCFNANTGGLLLYTRLGYQPRAIVERQAPGGQRVALVQMEKPLADSAS